MVKLDRRGARALSAALACCALAFAVSTGCVDQPDAPAHFNPADPDTPGTTLPGRPPGMTAEAGDRVVRLSWGAPAGVAVSTYHLYRSVDEAGAGEFSDWELLATGDSTRYVDEDVTNGNAYRYRVAAVTAGGQEGEFSLAVSAVPAVYTATLEGGALFTRSRGVTLALTAPAGTQLVRVSEDSTMTGAAFVAFTQRLPWTLSTGDGVKRLHAEFRGPHGESSPRVVATIRLDTVADLRSVVVSGAAPGTVTPGDTIRFLVDAGETDGVATVDIGSRATGVRLYDDGTRGDATAADGSYELDYVVPGGGDAADLAVVARFTDGAGNEAAPLTSPTRLTIGIPPAAVTLAAPTDSTLTSLKLAWSISTDQDFASYRLFRSRTAGVDTSSQRVLVTEIREAGTATFNDTGLREATDYYYLLYVYDDAGLHSATNEVMGRTANQVPAAVTLQQPGSVSATALRLDWSESSAADFGSYLVYRSTTPGVDTTQTLAGAITRRDERTLAVGGLTENTTWYFRVFVRDAGGFTSGSNEVSARTANQPPAPSTLNPLTGITQTAGTLSWSASAAHDFKEYRVYRDTTAAVTESSRRVRTIEDKAVTGFTDSGLRENTSYWYRLYVVDTGDSVAASAVVAMTTLNRQPAPVTLNQPDSAQVTSSTAHLSWSRSGEHDFERYQLFRSATPGVTSAGAPVFESTLTSLDFFDDVGLTDSTDYYYRVFVKDEGGLETGSNEIHVLTRP